MAKNFRTMALICSAIAILATISVYMFAFGSIFRVKMQWTTMLCIIIAEIITTCKLISVKKTIFGTANITISLIHTFLVIIASVIFINHFHNLVATYIWLNVVMLCILAIIDLVIIHSAERVLVSNRRLADSQAVVNTCYTTAQNLCTEFRSSPYIKDLKDIAELIKYSDNSILTNDEMTLLDNLEQLQSLLIEDASKEGQGDIEDNPEAFSKINPKIPERITEIKNLIKMRSIKVASQKRGGY